TQVMFNEGEEATDYEPYKESTLYLQAKDKEGNLVKLHSLPNGIGDRIYKAEDGKWYLEKNTKTLLFNGTENWETFDDFENKNTIDFSLRININPINNYHKDIPSLSNLFKNVKDDVTY